MQELMFPKPVKEERIRKPLRARTPLKAKTRLKPGKKPLIPRSKNPRKRAKQRAWDAISLYIRLSYADPEGYLKCFTCDTVRHYKEVDAGHFIHGDNMDFIEENLHPQCDTCNRHLSGNGVQYTMRMIKMYGVEVVEELLSRKHDIVKHGIQDFLNIEAKYKEKVKNL
jgi:hypothetical protein